MTARRLSGGFYACLFIIFSAAVLVKRRVAGVEVFGIEIILRNAESIAEALIVYYFTRAEEFYRVAHVGIVRKSENIVISRASLLLC